MSRARPTSPWACKTPTRSRSLSRATVRACRAFRRWRPKDLCVDRHRDGDLAVPPRRRTVRQRHEAEERREQQRQESEQRRLTAERRATEAEFRTEAVHAKVVAFERLLLDRNRNLAGRSRQAEDTFNARGPEAFVEVIQRALATSVYPDGLNGSCAAQYLPESRELLVEYEPPRQEVIPAVTGYRYVRTRDLFQPEPRKAAEVNKLYEKLIARMTLRTLAEAFGYVSAKDRATGKPVRPPPLSVQATDRWVYHHWPTCGSQPLSLLNDYGVAYSTNAVTWGRIPAAGCNSTDAAWSSACKT